MNGKKDTNTEINTKLHYKVNKQSGEQCQQLGE